MGRTSVRALAFLALALALATFVGCDSSYLLGIDAEMPRILSSLYFGRQADLDPGIP
jgi:hypothetical protein